jgi:hypothetical protein
MLQEMAAKFAGDVAKPIGNGLGNAIGGVDAGPFIGGAATAGAYGTTLDGAGWNVNLGGTQVATASPTRTYTDPGGGIGSAAPMAPAMAGASGLGMLMLAGAAVVWFVRKGHH